MAFYGVGLEVAVKEQLMQMKMKIKARGGLGLRHLKIIFNRMDFNGNKKLDLEEFEAALNQFGIFPKKVDLQAMMKYYDIDQDGSISYEEFVSGLKEALTPRRMVMVEKAFKKMDIDGSGALQVVDIGIYDVSKNKDFLDGKKSKEEVISEFLMNFEGSRGDRDGTITHEEFIDYYTDLSMSVPSDEYFVQMMESVWCVAEDEDNAIFKERLDHLVNTIRHKLQSMSGGLAGKTDENVLREIFKDYDLNGNGVLTIDEMEAMLVRMKISIERKYLSALFRLFDENKSGTIEFEEFLHFIQFDAYTK